MKHVLCLTFIALSASCLAAEYPVADVAAFNAAVAKLAPGDVVVLRAGEWKDADLVFRGNGTIEKPITLRGDGRAKLTGASRLRIAGEHLVIEGVWFSDCTPPKSDIIAFREDSKRLAKHCIVRDCAITQSAALVEKSDRKWLSIYGANNRVERCHFEGKTSAGTLLIVWLPEKAGDPPGHVISGNYFGPRPRLGKNGGEIIRVGDSDTSMQTAGCVVERNLFDRCDGEVECISNKSCGNIYRGNVFLETQGSLTLRHGNGCRVEKNVFLGFGVKSTGGIRVIGEDHTVVDNHLEGLRGDGARAAICVMNGIEKSPLSGYFQVKRAKIERNTIVDCKQSIVIGFADDDVKANLPPTDVTFGGNTVWAGKFTAIELIDPTATVVWKENRVSAEKPGIAPTPGIATDAFDRPPARPRPDLTGFGCSWMRPGAK